MVYFITAAYGIATLVNIAPVIGVLSTGQLSQLSQLYGVNIDSPDLIFLMRHRAMLFGLIGGFLLLSVFKPTFRTQAGLLGSLSMLSFIVLYMADSPANDILARLVWIDSLTLVILSAALFAHVRLKPAEK